MNVQEFLHRECIPFEIIEHAPAFDAQHLAGEIHEAGCHVAKTVLLHMDGNGTYAVAVLPAVCDVDFCKVSDVLEHPDVRLATDAELRHWLPDSEPGIVPPFGSHYGLRTLLDTSLSTEDEIVFEGEKRTEAVKMKMKDFQQFEQPMIVSIACE